MFIGCASCRHSVTRHLGGLRRVPKKALIALVLVAALGGGWLGLQLSGSFLGAHLGWPSWLVVAARIALGVAAALLCAPSPPPPPPPPSPLSHPPPTPPRSPPLRL